MERPAPNATHWQAGNRTMVRVRSLKHKITLGCIVLGLGALLTSTLSMVGMSRQDRALTQLQAATKLMRDHMEADMGHDAIRGEVVSIVASRQTGAIDGRAAARELAERLTDFEAKMEPATRASDAPAIVAARSAADPAFRSYVRIGREIAGQGMRGEVPDDARLARFQQLFSQLEGEMARISDAVEAHSVETTAHAEDVSAQSRWAGLVSMTALLTLLVLVARYLRLSVTRKGVQFNPGKR